MGYSPTLGRFLEMDPDTYIDGPNEYQLEDSNPLKFVDPSGEDKVGLPAGPRPTTGPDVPPDQPVTTQPSLPGNGPPIIIISPAGAECPVNGQIIVKVAVIQNDGNGNPAKDNTGNFLWIPQLELQAVIVGGPDGGAAVGGWGAIKQSKEHGNKIVPDDRSETGDAMCPRLGIKGSKQGHVTLWIRLKDYPGVMNHFPIVIGPPTTGPAASQPVAPAPH